MSVLRILGCGTSTGVPIPGCECSVCNSSDPKNSRTRTSAIVLSEAGNFLIDPSIDLRSQALTHKIKKVDTVLYTHPHADHILGTDDLRCFNFVSKKAIPCYGTKQTLEGVKYYFDYIFNPDPQYTGGMLADLQLNEIRYNHTFFALGKEILPFKLIHGKFEVTGYRFGELAYATDCNGIPEESLNLISGVKYLILDGLRYKPHGSHFTIPEAIDMAKTIGAEFTYLIHMTHDLDYSETNNNLPHGVKLAYDGLEIQFDW